MDHSPDTVMPVLMKNATMRYVVFQHKAYGYSDTNGILSQGNIGWHKD